MEGESSVAGVFDCVFSVLKIVPSLLLRENFVILVLRPQQVIVYITVVAYKNHILSFRPLVYKRLKLNNSSPPNEVAILEILLYLSVPFSFL